LRANPRWREERLPDNDARRYRSKPREADVIQTPQAIGTQEPRSPLVDRSVELGSIVSHDLARFYWKAYRQVGNMHDAEDAVQDALVSAYEHLTEFEGRSRLSTWLTTIVINAARLQLRRRRHVNAPIEPQFDSEGVRNALEETVADERPGPDEILASTERYRLMTELMKSLSPSLQKTMHHYYIDGMTAAEVAGRLDIPIGTVKARISRARARLRQALYTRTGSRLARKSHR
jgi:RNA polymerase sigma-70 factor, ECF subfamily